MSSIPETLATLAVPVDGLKRFGRNARRGDVAKIAESLRVNGQYRPIVVRQGTNEVLAGNHTLAAAIELGWEQIAATFVDCDDEQAAKIVLVDNRTNDVAGYDQDALIELLQSVEDLQGTGFTQAELDALLGEIQDDAPPATDPDDIPPAPKEPRTRLGDVWILGPHRVVCGDSTNPDVVAALMGKERAHLIWTDPPYGVAYVGKTKDALTIQNDELNPEQLQDFIGGAFESAMTVTQPGAPVYVASPAGPLFAAFGNALNQLGIWRQTIVWVKDRFVLGRSHFHYRHESIFYGWTPGEACLHPPAERTNDTVWDVDRPTRKQEKAFDSVWIVARPSRSADHPTMKPVELITRALELSSDRGDIVLDPFGGSGSTLIAAETTRRAARLVELEPKYVDVICRRYQEHTGTPPILQSTGEVHDFTR